MKNIVCLGALMLMMTSILGQDTAHVVVKDKHYYQSKSTVQLVVGSILFAGGVTMLVYVSEGNVDLDEAALLAVAGTVVTIAGVVVLIGSIKSKKKAKSISAYFKMERAPVVKQCSLGTNTFLPWA